MSPLHDAGWVAVRAMVPRLDAHRIMDDLWELGARGIIVTDIHSCRIQVPTAWGTLMSELPELPATFRPRKGRIVPYGFAVIVLAVCAGLAIALPGGTGRFALTDRLGVVGVGVVVAAFLCVLARPRLTADEGGLRVVNLFFARSLEWAEVVEVNFGRGDPWVLLDLADGDTLAVMAIQANDGERARRAAQQLRELVAAHSITDRND